MALYDELGKSYTATRRADPRIYAHIARALDDATSVVNIGAGTGSYEPPQTIAAVDPSLTMLSQRPADAAPVVQAVAEHLPLRANCADAAMAILTVHHWRDVEAGIAEMRRVARRRIVIFTSQFDKISRFWLLAEYLPAALDLERQQAVPVELLTSLLDRPRVEPVTIPHDCEDGFGVAYWRRPEAYLDPLVRSGISLLSRTDPDQLRSGLTRLADDLESGRWQREHADLVERDSLDLGFCLVIGDA
jgi:SAM-dependent methyltransferase